MCGVEGLICGWGVEGGQGMNRVWGVGYVIVITRARGIVWCILH